MPELPEVETIARSLRPVLVGQTILQAQVLWPRSLVGLSAEEFDARISGQRVVGVSRRAKYLDVELSADHLFVHLRMSGDLKFVSDGRGAAAPPRARGVKEAAPVRGAGVHDRLILWLSGGGWLVFNDTRKFGRVWLTAHAEDVLGRLGPEPLDAAFTAEVLYGLLVKKHRQIKPLLLDQSFLAGLGNIYTDEALHLSGVHPERISDTILLQEAQRLHAAIQAVLLAGIEHNGASFDWVYRGGGFQNYFRVYGREGQACPVCGSPIQKIVVGQRGTHFCPVCQEK